MKKMKTSSQSETGFTLLEVIVVTLILGILSAISAPSWFAFIESQRLLGVEEEVYRAVKEAQATALREKKATQISFRETTENGRTVVQYVIHEPPTPPNTFDENAVFWNNIDDNITLVEDSDIVFDFQGEIPEGTTIPQNIVIQSTQNNQKACLSVQTLLGALTRNCPTAP